MKYFKYKIANRSDIGTEETYITKMIPCTEANEEMAKVEAVDGLYEIFDDNKPAETPSQLDVIEAQVTYTAMMTDTLLGG